MLCLKRVRKASFLLLRRRQSPQRIRRRRPPARGSKIKKRSGHAHACGRHPLATEFREGSMLGAVREVEAAAAALGAVATGAVAVRSHRSERKGQHLAPSARSKRLQPRRNEELARGVAVRAPPKTRLRGTFAETVRLQVRRSQV